LSCKPLTVSVSYEEKWFIISKILWCQVFVIVPLQRFTAGWSWRDVGGRSSRKDGRGHGCRKRETVKRIFFQVLNLTCLKMFFFNDFFLILFKTLSLFNVYVASMAETGVLTFSALFNLMDKSLNIKLLCCLNYCCLDVQFCVSYTIL